MVLRFIKAREPLTKYVGSNSPWVGGKNGEKVGGCCVNGMLPEGGSPPRGQSALSEDIFDCHSLGSRRERGGAEASSSE